MYNDEEEDDDDLIYVMSDITELVNQVRKIVFAGFGFENVDEDQLSTLLAEIDDAELDETISFDECKVIAMDYFETKTTKRGKKKYILTNDNFNSFIEAVNARLVSNILTELVDKGQLESAWDEEANDFIFWVADNDEKNKKT